MAPHPITGFDLEQTDRLLTTTKQVRKRLDLSRPVPYEELLECIDIASHAPMGGNLERNRWMIIDDDETLGYNAEVVWTDVTTEIGSWAAVGTAASRRAAARSTPPESVALV